MQIVIVGGGFGGVRTALKLANKRGINVRLISDRSYFEYHAALYKTATGRNPLEVAIPLADIFKRAKNVEVVEDKVNRISHNQMYVAGTTGAKYKYDKLVLAIGSVTQYFGIKGLEKYSYEIKSVQAALKLKRHLHEDMGDRSTPCHYVVVGGGPSGVELAAEMVGYLKRVRRKHKYGDVKFHVDLVEAAGRVLPMMPADVSAKVAARLKSLGVRIYLKKTVMGETASKLRLPDGDLDSHTVVWTAGVKNHPLFSKYPQIFKLDHGKVVVDEYLRAATNTYVIGDSAAVEFAGLAQTALYQGEFVANHLTRLNRGKQPKPFTPKRPPTSIPVGPFWGAVILGKRRFYGFIGWKLRKLIDLKMFSQFLPLGVLLARWRYSADKIETCPVCD